MYEKFGTNQTHACSVYENMATSCKNTQKYLWRKRES